MIKHDNFKKSASLLARAKKVIPTASQTYSKSYRYFCEGAAPAFLEKGKDGHVWDVDGNKYIDFVLGLGPVIIGYNNEEINQAITNQLKKGISFSLSTPLEVELAEKLVDIIPCAEMVKFVKNGADATMAAVRLARAHTGRDIILCSGYHGFHDWYITTTSNDLGIPSQMKELVETFPYNDPEALQALLEKHKDRVAGVIMEPIQEEGPNEGYLEGVKRVTKEHGAVLIFDEVVSGFRTGLGGAQELYGVIPDLGAFGKGMGNGAAISFIAGKKEIMKLIDEGAFISTTFGGETIGLAAALATIKVLERPGVIDKIWAHGKTYLEGAKRLVKEKGLVEQTTFMGEAPHCGFIFKEMGKLSGNDLFSVFQQTLIEKGVLSLGINNFCYTHTDEDIKCLLDATAEGLNQVKKAIAQDSVEGLLKGGKITPIFKRN